MKLSVWTAAGLLLALAGCTTATTMPTQRNAIESRWVGQSAGKFFAAFGPPISEREDGSSSTYTWRGGYKTVTAATEGQNGKKGAKRKRYLRCQAEITTGADYNIRSIRVMGDIPGERGPSYCAEFLVPEMAAAQQ